MTLRVSENGFKLLRDLIATRSGIFLGEEKHYLIENRLSPLVESSHCPNFEDFYLRIKDTPITGKLWNEVLDAMTTNETSWFRDRHPFVTLKEKLLPNLISDVLSGKRPGIDIWSAACSTGEEPYSIAMTALDSCRTTSEAAIVREKLRILATDISAATLAKAQEGRYASVAISKGLSPELRDRYFKDQDGFWTVEEEVKKLVTFKQFNLKDSYLGLGVFDIVFMRNVIIYFSDELKKNIFNRIARIIAPGGHMFLGTGETVRNYTECFDILENNGAVFYRVVA